MYMSLSVLCGKSLALTHHEDIKKVLIKERKFEKILGRRQNSNGTYPLSPNVELFIKFEKLSLSTRKNRLMFTVTLHLHV